jgi:hypothetical protein
MKNPLKTLINEIFKIIFRCPYWRKCPYYDRDKCHEAWIMNGCGKYRKFEDEAAQRVTRLYEEVLKGEKKK